MPCHLKSSCTPIKANWGETSGQHTDQDSDNLSIVAPHASMEITMECGWARVDRIEYQKCESQKSGEDEDEIGECDEYSEMYKSL